MEVSRLSVDEERLFLPEFRQAGLIWAQYAAAATSVLLVLFMTVPGLSNLYTLGALGIRGAMLAALLCVLCVLRFGAEFAVRNYVWLVGGASGMMLLGLVALMAPPGFDAVSVSFSPVPAMFLGLFLNYAFLRLPLVTVSVLCWAFSLAVVIAVPHGFAGAGQFRLLVYLVALNALGMLLCRSIEDRERELFFQRRRAEAAQVESDGRASAAEAAHAEKSRLLAAVSHDLRQPIMAAFTYVSVMRSRLRKNELDEVDRQLGHLGDTVGMLGATVDHLLTAARYDSGNEPIRIEAVELRPIFEHLRRAFEPEANAKGIELRIRLPSQRVVVTSDATALWRVLMNLVSNAIKFTDAQGMPGRGVMVRARVGNGVCRIDVADTGIGIAAEHLQSIWQPYYQVQNAERNRARGLGLGLFLVRRALDHLEGHELRLRSRPGRGSRFTLLLPGSSLSDPRVVLRAPEPLEEGSLCALQGAYVLVLEDDRDARRAIQELLDDWGVVHVGAATLEELLPEAASAGRPPDALITDFRLPGQLSGAACVQELRLALGESFPAIIVTGESDLASVREVMPADTTLLPKPFEMAALARPLLMAVERARRAESL